MEVGAAELVLAVEDPGLGLAVTVTRMTGHPGLVLVVNPEPPVPLLVEPIVEVAKVVGGATVLLVGGGAELLVGGGAVLLVGSGPLMRPAWKRAMMSG